MIKIKKTFRFYKGFHTVRMFPRFTRNMAKADKTLPIEQLARHINEVKLLREEIDRRLRAIERKTGKWYYGRWEVRF